MLTSNVDELVGFKRVIYYVNFVTVNIQPNNPNTLRIIKHEHFIDNLPTILHRADIDLVNSIITESFDLSASVLIFWLIASIWVLCLERRKSNSRKSVQVPLLRNLEGSFRIRAHDPSQQKKMLTYENIVKCIKTRCSISQISSMIIKFLHCLLNSQSFNYCNSTNSNTPPQW